VLVRGQLVALKFARAKLAQLAATQPQVTELLIELLTRRLMTNLVQTSPLFEEFDAQARAELTSQFEVRRAARGTILADLGKVSDGLYISLTGMLEVTYADGRPTEQHPAGTLFGQSSLMTRSPSDIRVRATNHMLVLRLPMRGFQTIAMQYPSTLAHLSTLAETSVAQISG
jgi:signal-transduction protein with cAMP-binding, CBS, and nucleotidyltransferase domain